MATTDPLIGATLDGRYRIESRIAVGGMATVYLAHDARLDRRVALKVMRTSLAADGGFVQRFVREALSVAKLSHPNVVQVFDQGSDGQHVFLAMEYVAGRTLRDLLAEQGRLAPGPALEIVSAVLAGLAAAHRAGLVHRDIKPENVLLTADGQIKVADFGLARAVEAGQQGLTQTGTLMGTAAYLSPEQISDHASDARTDVYATGVMLYELLTGSQPHRGESPLAVAYQHVNEDVPRPSRKLEGLPEGLDDLVVRATERDPRYRYPDAGRYLAAMLEVRRALPDAATLPAAVHTPALAAPAEGGGSAEENPTLVGEFPGSFEEEPEGAGGSRSRYPVWLLAGVAIVAAAALGWWLLLGRYETVPDMVGMSEEEAQQEMSDAGLLFELSGEPVYSDEVEEGRIAETSPEPGDRILPGETVTAALSQGPQNIEMPDLVGEPAEEAVENLEDLGFTDIERQETVSYDRPVETVLSVAPEPGEPADREATVVLRVSTGFAAPSVVGLTEDEARDRLEENNLQVGVDERSDDDVPEGQVMEQEPVSGESVGAGDTVTIIVSSGPEEIDIPDVRGQSISDATEELEELGFEVAVERPFRIGNRVSDMDPEGSAPEGTEITLTVTPLSFGDDDDDDDDDDD